MDGRVKTWRLVYCVTFGLALGGVFGILIARFTPICPNVDLPKFEIPGLSTILAPMLFGGVDTPEESPTRLLFVGDIMLDRNVARRVRESKDPAYPFRKLPVGWFDTFDYAVANLEGPVTDKRRPPVKSIDFQFDPSVIPVLKSQGIDAFSQANNHALDQGNVGYADSVRRLREAGFLTFGHQISDDVIALATTTIRKTNIAFVGFNTTDNPLDRAAASSTIAEARRQSDIVIVYMHWGTEYRHKPDASSIATAQWLIDQGVDTVIGAHPHWEQGISIYKGKPIAWSLGNFIFDQDFSKETREGLALILSIDKKGIVIEPIPIFIDASQPRIVEGEERNKRLEFLASISDPELAGQIKEGVIRF